MSKEYEDLLKKVDEKVQIIQGTNDTALPVESDLAKEFVQDQKLEKKYGDKPIKAAALGAARSLSAGLSDQAFLKLGFSKEELAQTKDRNEIASLLGETAGIIVPTALSGGAGLLGSAARTASTGVRAVESAGLLAEKAFLKAISQEGKKSAAKEIAKRAAPKILGSSVEGAAYGAGQLISEEALGNAEFNAQNLFAFAGTGALLGGTTSGIFQAPKLLAPVLKSTGQKSSTIAKKYLDPFDNLSGLLKLSSAKDKKIREFRPDFVKEGPTWFVEKTKLGAFRKDKDLLTDISKIEETAIKKLNNTAKTADSAISSSNGNVYVEPTTFAKFAKSIQDFIDEKIIKPDASSKVNVIKKAAIKEAKNKQPKSISNLIKFKRELDENIPYGRESTKSEVNAIKQLRSNVENTIRDEIKKIDESLGTSLIDDYLNANKDISYSKIIKPALESKIAAAEKKAFLSNQDAMLGLVSTAALDAPGALLFGAKKLMESDIRRKVILKSAVEKSKKQVEKKVNSSIKSFIKSDKFKARAATTNALIDSNYSNKKNKKEAFKEISETITELNSNPEKLNEIVTKRTLHLQGELPATTANALATASKGIQFLASKLPKPITTSKTVFNKREYEPSELQLAKFEKYFKAVENPMSILDELEAGTLTRESAEAVQTVYPAIFSSIQNKVIEEAESSEKSLTYAKKVQLAILLDLNTDSSLNNENIAKFQTTFAPEEPTQPEQQVATPARADKLEFANRYETKQNKIAQK